MTVVEVHVCRERWVNACHRSLVNESILRVSNLTDLFTMYILLSLLLTMYTLLSSDRFLFYCLLTSFCLFHIKESDENIRLLSIYGYKV